jgi:hypothetical protein
MGLLVLQKMKFMYKYRLCDSRAGSLSYVSTTIILSIILLCHSMFMSAYLL